MKLKPLLTLFSLIAAFAPSLHAQPASATFRPALADEFSTSYTYSGNGGLSRGAATVGDVSLTR
ncbi:MAG: hypothetical protein ABI222_05740, partial [Opitutaceae bacterium]